MGPGFLGVFRISIKLHPAKFQTQIFYPVLGNNKNKSCLEPFKKQNKKTVQTD